MMEEATENIGTASSRRPKFNVKNAIIIVIILIVGSLVYAYKGVLIAATVDGSPIMRLTVVKELEKSSGKDLLDSLITEKLIQNEADARNIVVSDAEVDAAIKQIEDQLKAQGTTLSDALSSQKIPMNEFRKRIIIQKDLEKLLESKIAVTDEEVTQYIKDNKVEIKKGEEATINDQIKSYLKEEKMKSESQNLILELKAKAKINYFVDY